MSERKTYTAEQKVIILRELLDDKIPISQIAEKYKIHTNDIYNWKKKLFEGAADIFSSGKTNNTKTDKSQEKITALEAKLKKKEEAISWLVQDNIELKKNISGEN
jgi:transposase-like protein